jgi:hypothetical protein
MRRRTEGDGVRRKVGDRRIRARFDIVGDLWGSLETVLRLPLRNVSRGGALIHSHVPLPLQSVHRVALHAGDQELSVPVRVSHVDPQVSADGERSYLIGVEFVSAQPALLQLIDRLLVAGQGGGVGV